MTIQSDKLSRGLINDITKTRSGSIHVVIREAHPDCKRLLRNYPIKIEQEIPLIGAYVVVVPRHLIPFLAEQDCIRYIEQDASVHLHMLKAQQTIQSAALKNSTGLTGKGVTIAMVDSGIHNHSDFTLPINRIMAFQDLLGGREKPYDDNGHGTFCMGCAAGNGMLSCGEYAGVASEANLVVIKAFDRRGRSRESALLKSMQWVSDHAARYDIRVLSLSLGSESNAELYDKIDTMADAANELWNQGIVVVVSAGNEGPRCGTISTPGIASNVITVGAVDDRDGSHISVAPFSSRSVPGENKPEILAPGVRIVSTANNESGYTTMSGTSMSAPIVAGCAALMLEQNPSLTPDQLKEKMLSGSLNIGRPMYIQGSGLLQMLVERQQSPIALPKSFEKQ